MKPFTRIAAIVLGAFALGVFVVLGWGAVLAEVADFTDRMRRARCDWADPLPISIAGHEFSLAAAVGTTIFTGDRWIGGEEVSGYRTQGRRFGFCLDRVPETAMPVRAVTIGFAPAARLAEQAGLPAGDGLLLEIADAAMFPADVPVPVGQATELVVYGRTPVHGWPRMVTEGVGGDGFRVGAVCRGAGGGGWLCDVSVLDAWAGLSYRFAQLPVSTASFEARPLPAAFRRIAEGMRALVGVLEAEALARR